MLDTGNYVKVNIKVKHSHYGPGQALWFPEGWGFHILRQYAYEDVNVDSPTYRSLLTPGNIPGNRFC